MGGLGCCAAGSGAACLDLGLWSGAVAEDSRAMEELATEVAEESHPLGL